MKWWLAGILLAIAALYAWDHYSRQGAAVDLVAPQNAPKR